MQHVPACGEQRPRVSGSLPVGGVYDGAGVHGGSGVPRPVPDLAAIRGLFITLAASPRFFVRGRPAWAPRVAGHHVPVGSQPDLMGTVTTGGLPAITADRRPTGG